MGAHRVLKRSTGLVRGAACAALVLGLAAQPLGAQSLPVIDHQMFRLDNGLTVIVHTDRKTPVVAVNLWYHVGSKNEQPGKTGFAHLFEHLMFQGSENYRGEYFKPFELVGATGQNGTTNQDRTNYYQTVPTTALDMALWMESDRMGHLLGAIDQALLDEQRGVVQNEKRQGDNQPYGQVFETILRASYPEGHPYRWETIGSMEDLNAATLQDVHTWFKTYYGPNNAVLVLAGDIDVDTAKQKVEKYFGDIPPSPPITQFDRWVAPRAHTQRDRLQDRVAQTRIYRSWNVPGFNSEDADLLALAAQVLGGSAASWLDQRLVHEQQIASSVSAYSFPQELGGIFVLQADVKPDIEPDRVERAMDQELRRLLEKGPSAAELERAKTTVLAAFVRGAEQVNEKAEWLAQCQTFTGQANCFETQIKRAMAATPEQVRQAARRWLGGGDYVLTVQPYPQLRAHPSTVDRKQGVPGVTSFPEVAFPRIERATLSNGAKVMLAQRSGVPIVHVEFLFDAGFAADPPRQPGLASFTLDMMDEGAGGLSALEIKSRMESLGAQLGARSSLDASHVYVSALKDRLKESLSLLATVLLRPDFPAADLERVRKQALVGIEREKTVPNALALRLLPPLLYGADHPYGIPFSGVGTSDSVSKFQREDLVAFHRTWLRPDQVTILVAGDIGLPQLLPLLEKHFGSWKAPDAARPAKTLANVERPDQGRILLIDKPGAPQSILIGGLLAPDMAYPRDLPVRTANAILGGQFNSRLNLNLREGKHWSYGVSSFINAARAQRPLVVMAPVQTDKTVESLAEIQREFAAYLKQKPVTAQELSDVQMNDVRSMPADYETLGAVVGAMQGIVLYGRPDDYVQTLKARIEAQTLEQVRAAAQELIDPQRFTWIVIGDLKHIEKPLRDQKLGAVEVIDSDGKRVR